jgi:Immunity protein 63
MDMLTLSEIVAQVQVLAKRIDAQKLLYANVTSENDEANPFVKVSSSTYAYIIRERGQVTKKLQTTDSDELLRWIFSDITFRMASDFESKHRTGSADTRRGIFARQIELQEKLNPSWAVKEQLEIDKILSDAPYDDYTDERVLQFEKEKDAGADDNEAWLLACKKYPLPEQTQ